MLSKLYSMLKAWFGDFAVDLRGVSTVEYALMVVAVVAAVALAAGLLGGAFESMFIELSKDITAGLDKVAAST